MLTQITIEDENELAEREVFPKTINERILRHDNKLTLKSFFAFCSVFSQGKWRKDGKDFFSKILQRYIKELKLTVLLVLTE